MQDSEALDKMAQLVERMEKLCERMEKGSREKQQLDESIRESVADSAAQKDYYRYWWL